MAYFKINNPMLEALQFDPKNNDGMIPPGVKLNKALIVKGNPKIATAQTPEGIIYVYPTDWVVYDIEGFIRFVIKDKNFKAMFSELG